MRPEIIYNDLCGFIERVGILEAEDYDGMPIVPDAAPMFQRYELEKLFKFVRENPCYHIVTIGWKGEILYNRFVDDSDTWKLADGDANPNLVVIKARWRLYNKETVALPPERLGAKRR